MIEMYISAAFFIFGMIVGSFLNVAILRMHTGKSYGGRSGCLSCAHALSWHELVPVLSFFALRTRCAHCGSKISWQYPLVEICTGVLFMLVNALHLPFMATVFALIVVATLVVVCVYDIYHTIIPNVPLYTFLVSGLFLRFFTDFNLLSIVYGAAATAAPLAFIWLVSKGRAMGFGDVKLALGIGALLGAWGGLQALLIAFMSGAVVGLLLLYVPKIATAFGMSRVSMKSEIPFAPFLILGFFVLFFSLVDIMEILRV